MLQPLILTVQQINSTMIIAQTSNGERWQFPIGAVHGTPQVGQELKVIAVAVGAEDAGENAFAKTLLNEILNASPS
ncbi:MAG: hypothetical protein Q7N87_00325 [Candidatus Uhrbacteria bacterium]|nr:hypothetical protein [Candidatus Uhrbacteria bacterium]